MRQFLRIWHRVWLLPAVIAVVGCDEKKEGAAPPPPLVQVMTVEGQRIPLTHTWVGTLDGDVNAAISAQVSGYLLEQVYQNGSLVKKGDVLFKIDPRPFQASLDQAKGSQAQAQAQLTKDKLNADRSAELYKKQVISRQQYDDTLQQYEASKAAEESATAAVESAQLNLNFTEVESPIDGVSSIATAQVGDLVGPSTGVLATVTTVDPIKVNFSAAEQEYISFIKQFFDDPSKSPIGKPDGQKGMTELTLTLANGLVYPKSGELTAVNSTVNVGTGSLSLQGIFPNPGNLLRPGQFGLVTAVTQVLPDGVAVPQRAIGDLQGISRVGLLGDGNKVTMTPVTVGRTIGSLQVVEEGLKAGDVIVVEGLQKLKDGAV
ncbi:MAG: efflux RND transporter periplasmic adaptor subunit, partial [Chthoniobacterales bacterium]